MDYVRVRHKSEKWIEVEGETIGDYFGLHDTLGLSEWDYPFTLSHLPTGASIFKDVTEAEAREIVPLLLAHTDLCHVENGRHGMGLVHFLALCRVYNTSPDALLGLGPGQFFDTRTYHNDAVEACAAECDYLYRITQAEVYKRLSERLREFKEGEEEA